MKIKLYTNRGLITSATIRSYDHMMSMLYEIVEKVTITKAYLSDGKGSKVLHIIKDLPYKRPTCYKRSDNVTVLTLPSHPKFYPITAYYIDGNSEVITLSS